MDLSFEISLDELKVYLIKRGQISPNDTLNYFEKPGEGNMNFVARIHSNKKSFILKQAFPYVQKYPQISAPVNRIHFEAKFYQAINPISTLSKSMPELYDFDEANHILLLQDFTGATDYSFLYGRRTRLTDAELQDLITFLNLLHELPIDKLDFFHSNVTLRKLNHEHIFQYPFSNDNNFDLNAAQEGLQEISLKFRTDSLLKFRANKLGELYLAPGSSLLHGDFYPGSWLKTSGGLKIIDPEFSYLGLREFEIGVLLAHLMLIESESHQINFVVNHYKVDALFNWNLAYQFAGIEIMRRIIGLAQLPLTFTVSEKEKLLNEAYYLIMRVR